MVQASAIELELAAQVLAPVVRRLGDREPWRRSEILARGQHGPVGVLVAGDDVYWVNLGYWENALDGSLMRMRKPCP